MPNVKPYYVVVDANIWIAECLLQRFKTYVAAIKTAQRQRRPQEG